MTANFLASTRRIPGAGLLILIALLAVYHLLLLFGLLPPLAAWGGRAAELPANFTTLEVIALGILALFAFFILGYLRQWGGPLRWLFRVACGLVAVYFSLNVALNLLALGLLERLIFTPLSLLMAALAWWLVFASQK